MRLLEEIEKTSEKCVDKEAKEILKLEQHVISLHKQIQIAINGKRR